MNTVSRPIFKIYINKGFQYFNTAIKKPIWLTGTRWIDATGADT
jgi:hypothetical protein